MANEVSITNNKVASQQPSSVKAFMAQPSTIKRVEELLGDRSSQFLTSVSSMVGADDKLARCEPVSLFMACLTAAALDLPINKNLGFAHIVPYENKKAGVIEAQYQMGWKGYIQLAQRTGQYKTIATTEVYDGQLTEEDPLTGNTYDWKAKNSDKIIGYVAKFKLVSGFEKELYMSLEDVTKHAKKYSKAYGYDLAKGYKSSPWSTNFDAMSLKTVVKLLISKWGPMSVEMQKAMQFDQAIIRDNDKVEYVDGELSNVGADDDKKAAIIAASTEAMNEVGVAAKQGTQAMNDLKDATVDVTDEDLDNLEASGGQSTLIDEPKAAQYGDNPQRHTTGKR